MSTTPEPTLRSELARMAALCGLEEEPYSFAAGEACGIGGVPTAQHEPWLLEPDRGTGRTTRIILLALLAVEAGYRVRFASSTFVQAREVMTLPAREFAAKAGLDRRLILQPTTFDRLKHGEPMGFALTFRDHSHQQTLVRS